MATVTSNGKNGIGSGFRRRWSSVRGKKLTLLKDRCKEKNQLKKRKRGEGGPSKETGRRWNKILTKGGNSFLARKYKKAG